MGEEQEGDHPLLNSPLAEGWTGMPSYRLREDINAKDHESWQASATTAASQQLPQVYAEKRHCLLADLAFVGVSPGDRVLSTGGGAARVGLLSQPGPALFDPLQRDRELRQ